MLRSEIRFYSFYWRNSLWGVTVNDCQVAGENASATHLWSLKPFHTQIPMNGHGSLVLSRKTVFKAFRKCSLHLGALQNSGIPAPLMTQAIKDSQQLSAVSVCTVRGSRMAQGSRLGPMWSRGSSSMPGQVLSLISPLS